MTMYPSPLAGKGTLMSFYNSISAKHPRGCSVFSFLAASVLLNEFVTIATLRCWKLSSFTLSYSHDPRTCFHHFVISSIPTCFPTAVCATMQTVRNYNIKPLNGTARYTAAHEQYIEKIPVNSILHDAAIFQSTLCSCVFFLPKNNNNTSLYTLSGPPLFQGARQSNAQS